MEITFGKLYFRSPFRSELLMPCAEGYAAFANGTTPETWTVAPFKVKYVANNGSDDSHVIALPDGDHFPQTITVEANSYEHATLGFANWNTQADGSGDTYWPNQSTSIDTGLTLYAQWANVMNATTGATYNALQAAIDAATAGDSLVVLTDLHQTATIAINKSLSINGNKHVITSTKDRGMWFDAGNVTLNLKNFYFDGTGMDETQITTRGIRAIQVDQDNVTLNMDSCRIYNVKEYPFYVFRDVDNANVTIKNSYIKGLSSMRSYASNSTFNFMNDTLYSTNPCTNNMDYANIYLDGNYEATLSKDNTISIEKCVIISEAEGSCHPEWLGIAFDASGNNVTVDANTKIIDGNEQDMTSNLNIWLGGGKNYVTMPLTNTQIEAMDNNNYTVTASGSNSVVSAPVLWEGTNVTTLQNGFNEMYIDFHAPFLLGLLETDDVLTLDDDITLKDTVFPGGVKFTLNLATYNITTGDNCILLSVADTVITDEEVNIFCAEEGIVNHIDNGDGTYTYYIAHVLNANTGNLYDDLQSAIDAATAGDSLVVLTDLTITQTSNAGVLNVEKSLIINGAKHTITTSARRGLWVNASDVNLTLRNLDLDCINTSEEYVRGIQINGKDDYDNVISNVNLVIDSCRLTTASLQGKSYALNFPCFGNHFNVTVKNSYMKGWAVVNSYAQNTHFIFENDTLHGVNQLSTTQWDDFATINLDGGSNNSCGGVGTGSSDVIVDITNSVVIAEKQGTCNQNWINISYGARNVNINVDCNTKFVDGPAAGANDISEKLFISSLDNFTNDYTRGSTGAIVVKLNSTQMDALVDDDYTLKTVTDDCEKVRVSHSAYYTYSEGNLKEYIDFNAIFTDHRLYADEQIDLLEDVTLTADLYVPFTGNFTIHFTDGSDVHSITQGDYSIVLDDDQTCTTDKQVAGLFTAFSGSDIIETDNGDNTYTYSVAPYYTIVYYSNNSADEDDSQVRPYGETVYLKDYTTFTHADSTIYRWNTQADGNGTDYALGAAYSEDSDIELYAVWRLNLDMTMDSTDVVCYGENNGTDTVKIIGGDAPYQIVLSSTVMAENDTVKNLMDRTYIFTNLVPGTYNVQLTDVLTKDTIRGTFSISQPDTLIVESMTVPENPCPLMGSGVYDVSMTTIGGNGGNHFTWGEAAVNVDAMASTVIPGADDRDSTYTVAVKVTDKKGCVATDTTTFTVSKVIADDGTVHSNSKLTIDTIRVGIMSGCDTVYKEYGTPVFTTTIPGGYPEDRLTIVNNIATAYPDSVFYLGENKIIWTATDTCGHSITGEQVLIVYHYPCPNVTDVDGNDYTSVRLGCDCWMAENLRTSKYSDGRDVSNLMKYESPTHPDADANFAIYGYLYDWTAALDAENGVTMDAEGLVQGICPTGWHMPTDLDFMSIAGVNGTNDISELRYNGYWLDGGGDNSTGFSLLPGGFYNDNTARYENILGEAYLWSVNSANPGQPKVFWADCKCYLWQVGDPSANLGCSVRCVKD